MNESEAEWRLINPTRLSKNAAIRLIYQPFKQSRVQMTALMTPMTHKTVSEVQIALRLPGG